MRFERDTAFTARPVANQTVLNGTASLQLVNQVNDDRNVGWIQDLSLCHGQGQRNLCGPHP